MKALFFLTPLIIGLVMGILKHQLNKSTQQVSKEPRVTVHLPRYYAFIGIVETLFFIAIPLGRLLLPEIVVGGPFWAACLVFSPYIIMGLSITIATLVWKIQVTRDEDYFLYTTFFGRIYKIYYKDITYYKFGISTTLVRTVKKGFLLRLNRSILRYF